MPMEVSLNYIYSINNFISHRLLCFYGKKGNFHNFRCYTAINITAIINVLLNHSHRNVQP